MPGKRLDLSFLFAIFLGLKLYAQPGGNDSSFVFDEVEVVADRLNAKVPGLNTTSFDSGTTQLYQQLNLADLLTNETGVFIRSYGLGSLATPAMRGGSAYHTAVLWNGFSLSSPMNGQVDLSLIPLSSTDDVQIQHGGSSALFGSGAISGVVHLSNHPTFDQGFTAELALQAGSFSDFRQQLMLQWSQKKYVSKLKVFHAFAQNDFPFQNPYSPEGEDRRQTHAEFRNWGIISENRWRLGNGEELSFNAWWQHTDRNIPPTLLQDQGSAQQEDQNLRLTTEWTKNRDRWTHQLRVAYFQEGLLFDDSIAGISDLTRAQQLIAEGESRLRLNASHSFNFGLHNTFATADHPNFDNSAQQNRFALFASHSFLSINKKWQSQVSARTEWLDGTAVPFTFSAGVDYRVLSWLMAKSSFSRVYRIPTLNDLYWRPGGNTDLLPEEGYSGEIGLMVHDRFGKLDFTSEVTAYSRNIDNWIIWMPGLSFWQPQNIASVWSRGIESNTQVKMQLGKVSFTIGLTTNYVLSTNQKARSTNDQALNKQHSNQLQDLQDKRC